jgi:hypothetical protein
MQRHNFSWNCCTASTAFNIFCYVWRSVKKGSKEKWTLNFFLSYRLLIEVSILQAAPASWNRDRDRFQRHTAKRENAKFLFWYLRHK